MLRRNLPVAVYFALWIGTGQVRGQASPEPASLSGTESVSDEEFNLPVSESLAGRIDALAAQLGSPSYKEREDATTELIKIGVPAFKKLRAAYHESDELEVRLRIERIVSMSYMEHHLYNRNGFLGIRQSGIPKDARDDPRIPEGQFGVEVVEPLDGTAAMDAGIRDGDVIIALNGEGIGGDAVRVTRDFGESIRVLGPGAILQLTILRGPRVHNLQVTLRPRPKEYYGARQGVVAEMRVRTRERYRTWWAEHFNRTPPPPNEQTSDGDGSP